MKRMVRYKIKAERVAENERLVRQVFEALSTLRPAGLRYATFRLDDGVFMHIVSHDGEAARQALVTLPAFKAFSADIASRCEEPPVTVDLNEVGSYGLFDTPD
jgi:quinol monooxygenase YgiN